MVVRQNARTSYEDAEALRGRAGDPRLGARVHTRHQHRQRRETREKEPRIASLVAVLLVVGLRGRRPAADDNNDSSSSVKGPDINAQGEGKLNIVDWEGYTDPSFVKAFEKQTGCKVNDTFAGTSDEMFTKFQLRRRRAVRPRLVLRRRLAAGDQGPARCAELDTSKLTNFNEPGPAAAVAVASTPSGRQALRHLVHVGRERPDLQRRQDQAEPRLLERASTTRKYKGKITVPDNPIQIADPALQFFGAEDPYAIDQATLDKVKDKLKQQRSLVRKYWVLATDFEQLFKSGDATIGAGWPLMTNDLKKAGMQRQGGPPEGGRHRLVGLVDALEGREAPDLRLPVHELRHAARRAGARSLT